MLEDVVEIMTMELQIYPQLQGLDRLMVIDPDQVSTVQGVSMLHVKIYIFQSSCDEDKGN